MPSIRNRHTKKKPSYTIIISLGSKNKAYCETFYPDPSRTEKQQEKEAWNYAIALEARMKGKHISNWNPTFREYAGNCLEKDFPDTVKDTTLENYSLLLNIYAFPEIGEKKLKYLSIRDIKDMRHNIMTLDKYRLSVTYKAKDALFEKINQYRSDGGNTTSLARENNLSPKIFQRIKKHNVNEKNAKTICKALGVSLEKAFETITRYNARNNAAIAKKVIAVVQSVLTLAVQDKIILENPARGVQVKYASREIKAIPEEHLAIIISNIERKPLKCQVAFYMGLLTGLRPCEMLGLNWTDLRLDEADENADGKMVAITKSRLYIAGKGVVEDTLKRPTAVRESFFPSFLLSLLKRLREQAKDKEGPVLDLHPSTLSHFLPSFTKELGLPHYTDYALRHTYGSYTELLADVHAVKIALGHTSEKTSAIYIDSVTSRRKQMDISKKVTDYLLQSKNLSTEEIQLPDGISKICPVSIEKSIFIYKEDSDDDPCDTEELDGPYKEMWESFNRQLGNDIGA